MTDYATWPEVSLAPAGLLLDDMNDRLPDEAQARSQRDVLHELITNEDGYSLARDIAKGGWLPLESMIGVTEGATVRILEGNRRLAVLKGMLDPDLVPAAFKARFEKLGPTAVPAHVRILMAPDRRAAAGLILRKHTRDQVRRWEPLMQARFYRRLVKDGESAEDVASAHGLTAGEVLSFLRMDTLYKVARGLELEGAAREAVDNPRQFNASALERLLETKNAQTFFHMSFDEQGGFSMHTTPAAFKKAYTRVISDIATKAIDTRSLNKAQQVDAYLERIADLRPPKTSTASSSERLFKAAKPAAAAPVKPKPTKPKSQSVIPANLKCQIDEKRVQEIFLELKRMRPLEDFLNGHSVLLRVFLEFCVLNYTTKTGLYKKITDRIAAKGNKGPDHSPTLTQMLNEMRNSTDVPLSPPLRKLIGTLVNDEDQFLHVDRMDGLVHNPAQWPTERELRRLWKELAPLFALVMVDPPAKP